MSSDFTENSSHVRATDNRLVVSPSSSSHSTGSKYAESPRSRIRSIRRNRSSNASFDELKKHSQQSEHSKKEKRLELSNYFDNSNLSTEEPQNSSIVCNEMNQQSPTGSNGRDEIIRTFFGERKTSVNSTKKSKSNQSGGPISKNEPDVAMKSKSIYFDSAKTLNTSNTENNGKKCSDIIVSNPMNEESPVAFVTGSMSPNYKIYTNIAPPSHVQEFSNDISETQNPLLASNEKAHARDYQKGEKKSGLDPVLLEQVRVFVQDEVKNTLSQELGEEIIQSNQSRHRSRSLNIAGFNAKLVQNGRIENDIFSMMMLSPIFSITWLFGWLSFSIQVLLGVLIILDQVEKDFFGTQLSIPIKVNGPLYTVQFLAIILSVMTQMDLLIGLKTLIVFSFPEKEKWGNLIGIKRHECKIHVWLLRIFVPNFLKILEGGLILGASFVVIIQSDNVVDVLKDYSALFVVSSVDNLFFDLADMGYFGTTLSQMGIKVKLVEYEECEKESKYFLQSVFCCLMCGLLGASAYVKVGQNRGKYVQQAFPLCPVNTTFKNSTFLDTIADGTCQFRRGKGTNVAECGWDGGDCHKLNERYPLCAVDDFSSLGNDICNGENNNKDCGFDNGDCVSDNKEKERMYPGCGVDNIAWIGDGICNGGIYFTPECEYDGGDCKLCAVENMRLIGNNICDKGQYNTKGCSYDGGDCIEYNLEKQEQYFSCAVENIGWIGDGVCNGRGYATPECENDGGDCIDCLVEDMMLIGNGFCDGGSYMSQGCSLDGGDCEFCKVVSPELLGNTFCNGNEYNTRECGYDGGDCIEENSKLQQIFPNCTVQNPWMIGDGVCNGGAYNTSECAYDSGDCANCIVDDPELIGDGICHGRFFNTKDCGSDGLDCAQENRIKQTKYPFCTVKNIGWIANGICDGREFASFLCGNDGGDCNDCNAVDKSIIGDDICDEGEYNTEGCSFDGFDCVPSMKLLGDPMHGDFKWAGGVLGHDGLLYGIPDRSRKVMIFNPKLNETKVTGQDLGSDRKKWWGGVVDSDGIIYGVPHNANSILRYDPIQGRSTLIAEEHPLLASKFKFNGGVLGKDHQIYFMPSGAHKILKFDPTNEDDPLIEIGSDLGDTPDKFFGGVVGPDGNVYGIPIVENRVLKITTRNDTMSFLPVEIVDSSASDIRFKWFGGALAKDGNIYACPFTMTRVLQINIKTQTTRLVGPDLGNDDAKWKGFVEGVDGFLYGIPFRFNKLLRFDPISHKATLLPIKDSLLDDYNWFEGVRAQNGLIYAFPANANHVTSIEPLTFRP